MRHIRRSKRRTGSEHGWRIAAVAGVLGIVLMLVLQFWPADGGRVRAEPSPLDDAATVSTESARTVWTSKPGVSESRVSGPVVKERFESGNTESQKTPDFAPPISPEPEAEPLTEPVEPIWANPPTETGPPDWSAEAPPAESFAPPDPISERPPLEESAPAEEPDFPPLDDFGAPPPRSKPIEVPAEPAPESEFIPPPATPTLELDATRVPSPPEDRNEQFLAESTAAPVQDGLGVNDPADEWHEHDPTRQPSSADPLLERAPSSLLSSAHDAIEMLPSQGEPAADVPGARDLAVTIEKSPPEFAAASQPATYDITVRNDGQTAIDQLVVEERVTAPHRIIDASGQPGFDREGNVLRWEIRDLQPTEQDRFTITVVPEPTGRAPWAALSSVTTVRPAVAVSAATTVESAAAPIEEPPRDPLFAVRRISLLEAAVGQPVRCTNRIINRSGHDLLRVTVTEHLPAGMELIALDDDGCFDEATRSVTWLIGTLPADGEVFRTLTLRPQAAGVQRSRITATAEGQRSESFESHLDVPSR